MEPLTVPGKLESLARIRNYTSVAAQNAGLEKARSYRLCLAVDEIASNIINYGYIQSGIDGDICIAADMDEQSLTITLDDTAKHFDPTEKQPPKAEDFELPLEERVAGGWGVYLAIQGVDQFRYNRVKDHNQNIFIMYRDQRQ